MTDYLFNHKKLLRDKVLRKIKSHNKIILFLDYDGTLTPIKKIPSLAVLSNKKIYTLKNLMKNKFILPVIITGREYNDIKKILLLPGLIIASNHGFRITDGNSDWIHPRAKVLMPIMNKIYRKLLMKLKSIPGVLVENKKITITVHYRNTEEKFIHLIKNIVDETAKQYFSKLKITEGKKVYEIRPDILWDKGNAVSRIIKLNRKSNKNELNIYIGDDKTDEDAFRILDNNAIKVRVGYNRNTMADYYVKNTNEVQIFLKTILSIKQQEDKI